MATKIKIIFALVFEMDLKHMIELNSIMAYSHTASVGSGPKRELGMGELA